MKDYLKQTIGHLRTDGREEWEVKACSFMLCHNNHAERPFAVLRQQAFVPLSLPGQSVKTFTVAGEWDAPSRWERHGRRRSVNCRSTTSDLHWPIMQCAEEKGVPSVTPIPGP
jgi:hypothetical protein